MAFYSGLMKHILAVLIALLSFLSAVAQDNSKPLPKDIRSLTALAEKGDVRAQFKLGVMYDDGVGVGENNREAVKWFSRAARQEHHIAQYSLGWMYAEGDGVLEDDKEAVKWFLKAAEKGYYKAQYNLGVMYTKGEGVLENDIDAWAWLSIAATNGDIESRKIKNFIARQMSPAQISKAQELSKVFQTRIQNNKKDTQAHKTPPNPAQRRIRGFGTGFFITDDGYLLTNYHVVKDAEYVSIKTEKGVLAAKIIKIDALNDLAVLKAQGQFRALPIISSRKVTLGDEVFTIGFPRPDIQGFSPKLTKGVISSLAGIKDDPRNFQISVQIQPGNSGGALVNAHGNMVGVVVSRLKVAFLTDKSGKPKLDLPQDVNYAVKSSYANSFLESLPKVVIGLKEPQKRTTSRKFSDSVKEVQEATVLVVIW